MNQGQEQILLVEDEPALQFVLEQQLLRLGYPIAGIAENGTEAVEKALAQKFDLIFMDVRLPIIDGLIATQRIRQEEEKRRTHTIIIGMTAFAQKGRCLEMGMDDFLQKPILIEQIQEMLDKWLIKRPVETVTTIQPAAFQQTENRLKKIADKLSEFRNKLGMDT